MKKLIKLFMQMILFIWYSYAYAQELPYWDVSYGYELRGPESAPSSLCVFNNTLYIGGYFKKLNSNTSNTITTNYIAAHKDSLWKPLLHGLNAPVYSMQKGPNNVLYISGLFTGTGTIQSSGIIGWENDHWKSIDGIQAGNISTLASDSLYLYAAGKFNTIGTIKSESIARYDGKSWSPLGLGIRLKPGSPLYGTNPQINAMAVYNNTLFVGGHFDSAGSISARNIAMWDGITWHSLGNGIEGDVDAITILSNGTIYVASSIVNGTYRIPSPLHKWDGKSWTLIPLPQQCTAIHALANDGTTLFIGGAFTIDEAKQDYGIAQFTSNSWTSIGGGVVGTIQSLLYDDGTLYCGGNFLKVNHDIPCRNIAAYSLRKKVREDTVPHHMIEKIEVFPNPVHDRTLTIEFVISQDGFATLGLFTTDGKEIHRITKGYYTKGVHRIEFDHSSIPSGTYQCIINQQGFVSATSIIISK